jgi:serine/threonine protein kinase
VTFPRQEPGAPTDGRLVGRRDRLLRSLGRGGMGVVWAGRDEVLDRDVAVKEVTPPPGLDDTQRAQLRARTLREARAAARIRSTAAVTVYDVVEEDGRPWIVMELLAPRTLADVLREEGPLSVEEASRIGLRLLDALTAAHAAGVLHRDVKPANVLYDSTGQAVLTDFGIASLEGDSSMTTTGMIVGSPGYVAPERAMGRSPSPASDLWSLGVTLATAVHGRSPFERDTPLATLVSAVQEPLPEWAVTGPLGAVLEGLLRKAPEDRPDIDAVRRMLHEGQRAPATRVTALFEPSPRANPERTQALSLPVSAVAAAARASAAPPSAPRTAPRSAPPPPGQQSPVRPPPSVPPAFAPEPGPDGSPPPAQPAPRRRSRSLAVLLALAILVVAGIIAAVVLDSRDPDTTSAGTDSSPSSDGAAEPETDPTELEGGTDGPTEAPSTDQEPDTTTSPPEDDDEPTDDPTDDDSGGEGNGLDPGQAPAGFEMYTEPAYKVAVPEGWAVTYGDDGVTTYFNDPASRRYLLVAEGGEPAGDPVEDWRAQAEARGPGYAEYEEIGIDYVDYRDFLAADWEFTWNPGGGTVRVRNRAVVDEEKNLAFALYWHVPVEEWEQSEPVFEDIAASFRVRGR